MTNEQKINLKIGIDEKSQAQAKRALADIGKNLRTFDAELQRLNRDDKISKLTNAFAKQAGETNDSRNAVLQLNKELANLGASEKEVQRVAREFDKLEKSARKAGQATSGAGGAGGASVKVSQFGGVAGALSPVAGGAVSGLAGVEEALGALSGASAKTVASLGAMGLAVGAVMIAVDAYHKQAMMQADELSGIIDSQRMMSDVIIRGLTTDEALEQIERLNQQREFEADLVNRLREQQEAYRQGLENSFGVIAPIVEWFLGIFDERPKRLNTELEKAGANIDQFKRETELLNRAVEDGSLSANDATASAQNATQAETDLASARAKQTSETDNLAREEERRAQEAQRQAEQQAQEAQRQAEQMANARKKYNENLSQIARATADALDDLVKTTRRTIDDNQLSLQDDLSQINQSARDEQVESSIKALEAERDAYRDHYRNLESIRKNALDEEKGAIASRNFALVAQLRERYNNEIDETQRAFEQQQSDEAEAQRRSNQEGLRDRAIERRERLEAYQQQQRDLAINLVRQINDLRSGEQRKLRDAQMAYAQEQQQFANHLQARVNLQAQSLARESAMTASGGAGGSRITSGFTGGTITALGGSGTAGLYERYMEGLRRAVASSNSTTRNSTVNMNINGASSPRATANEITRILREVGLA